MIKPYSQSKALLAITKASLKAILKHPTAIIFSLGFPLIFTWIFGSFNEGGAVQYKLALSKNTDTVNNIFYNILSRVPVIKFVNYSDSQKLNVDLQKGRLVGIIDIQKQYDDSLKNDKYNVHLQSTNASMPDLVSVIPILESIANKYEKITTKQTSSLVTITKKIDVIRAYKQIDFILPGQIGFSILFSTLFGIAFTFYGLREQLVLKRFYASPVNKIHILLGIGFSRLFFQMINVIVLIIIGHYLLGFTLANGVFTFLQMVALSFLLLMILMGVGLIFSSIVKQDSTIPLLINLFALPQMLLGGTFFSINVFPEWMQTLCKIFPLTHFNIAIRKISFEGLSLIDCWQNIGVLSIWLIVVYLLVYKIFKWE
jgi:ABC-2 type transport system permease protein